jgi:hypothetical protein
VEQHPKINDLVVLRDHSDREFRSRVEDLGSGLLVVVRPHELPADEELDAGTELSVVWTDSDGAGGLVLPTRIMTARTEGTLRLWSLVVTGPAVAEQRRQFVRAAATGPVAIRSAKDPDSDPVPGSLVDVSEGAVRCSVAAGAADRFLAGPPEVVAEFRFGSVDFAVPGHVEFLRPTAHPADLEELVVVFDEPVEVADALRKQIFAQQRRALRVRDKRGH